MESIVFVVEEQEQEQEEGSESGFVDLDLDTLHEVLKRVDAVTLARAECVNTLWRKAARDERLWGMGHLAFRKAPTIGFLFDRSAGLLELDRTLGLD